MYDGALPCIVTRSIVPQYLVFAFSSLGFLVGD